MGSPSVSILYHISPTELTFSSHLIFLGKGWFGMGHLSTKDPSIIPSTALSPAPPQARQISPRPSPKGPDSRERPRPAAGRSPDASAPTRRASPAFQPRIGSFATSAAPGQRSPSTT